MMRPSYPFLLVLCLAFGAAAPAATYFVATHGDDSNPGSHELPWRTIQRATQTLVAGDTVRVQPGEYDERIQTGSGGSHQTNRITFLADGRVIVRGWRITSPFISVRGFEMTGYSPPDVYSGCIEVTANGDHFEFVDNVVRDGIHHIVQDAVFTTRPDGFGLLSSAEGGFLNSRFQPGQTIWIARASSTSILNGGEYRIASLDNHSLVVTNQFATDGPKPVYLTGSRGYSLNLRSGSEHAVIHGNTFDNLSFDAWFIQGSGHRLETNTITRSHGWDAIHFMGSDHVFRGNFISAPDLLVFQNSPDAFENWPATRYERILFTGNFIHGFAGVLGVQKLSGITDMGPLTISHNIFVDVNRFSIRFANTTVRNNVFLNVGTTGNPVTATSQHALTFSGSFATAATIENNVFVGCGTSRNPNTHGWYEVVSGASAHSIGPNFVSGPAPEFAPKSGFLEGIPLFNGGDPGFVNVLNPLGPDGIPFTADDGLRLRPGSKLFAAGAGGLSLGAYLDGSGPVQLAISPTTEGEIIISWPASGTDYTLQRLDPNTGTWSAVDQPPQFLHDRLSIRLLVEKPMELFRLAK